MQRNDDSWTVLHDLAIIYLAAAHGTDNDLSDDELAMITDRLQAWQPDENPVDIQEVVLEALAVYEAENRSEEIDASVRAVRGALPPRSCALIIDDLTHIAIADHVFLHEEGGFIGMLAKIWDVHPETDG